MNTIAGLAAMIVFSVTLAVTNVLCTNAMIKMIINEANTKEERKENE